MVQSKKSLLRRHENLSSDPQTHVKKRQKSRQDCTYNHSTGEWRQADSGTQSPVSLDETELQATERLCQNIRWRSK